MKILKPLYFLYAFLLASLFLYSFTQVDLSLTLSKLSIYQTAEKQLQFIGFFQRPLSTVIFSVIVFLMFAFYLFFLNIARKNIITLKGVKVLVFLVFVFLAFSYNAFSYDLFNYIFDAKIVTYYHLNPYLHKASDFQNDSMLNFMRWTHRYFPYGPTWLLFTIPLSFIGMGYFLPTFFLFKLLMGLSFLGSCFLIYKISEKIFPKNKIFNVLFFSLNPLVIIESLISSHNDITMIFLLLLSIYLFISNKLFSSLFLYVFSMGVKFSTGILAPLAIYIFWAKKAKKKINWERFFIAGVALSLLTVLVATVRTTFQPWYLVFPLSMASFIPKKNYIFIPSLIGSLFGVLIYVPYVFMTDYAKGYPLVVQNIEVVGLIAVTVPAFIYIVKNKLSKAHID